MKFFTVLAVFFILCGGFLFAYQANASKITDSLEKVGQESGYNVESGGTSGFVNIVANLIKVVLSVLGVVLVALIIYAGVKWMTAGGDPKAVGEAKTTLTNAVIGLVIIVSAWAITVFVTDALKNAEAGTTTSSSGSSDNSTTEFQDLPF